MRQHSVSGVVAEGSKEPWSAAFKALLFHPPGPAPSIMSVIGFSWVSVSTIEAVKAHLDGGAYDILVVESHGPGMVELLENIRSYCEEGLPAVLVGDPWDTAVPKVLQSVPIDGFINPSWPEELIRTNLESAIERVQSGRNMVSIQRSIMSALEVAQVELIRAREEALESMRAKSRFLAVMSHEIRTPLNGIIGMTVLALDGELSPDQREQLGMAHESATGLLDILNGILDFSKVESGRLLLEQTRFDLKEALVNALAPLAVVAHEKGVVLEAVVGEGIPRHLVGDSVRLKQIVTNLVNNAVKFSNRGRIEVSLDAAADGSPDMLQLSVRDEGIGIPPAELERVFEPFAQADGSTTRRFGGTGLGLAICRQLAELMGGRIWAESEAEHGSTFHVTMRLRRPPEEIPDPNRKPLAAGTRILSIGHALKGLESSLEREGAHVEEFLTLEGASAALKAEASGADLVVLRQDESTQRSDIDALTKVIGRGSVLVLTPLAGPGPLAGHSRCRRVTNPLFFEELLEQIEASLRPPAAVPVDPGLFSLPETGIRRPLHVLVADDNRVNQEVVKRLLLRMGHSVTVVADGRAAVRAAEEARFDVVLMDIQMPEMDGNEAAVCLRRREIEFHLDRIPIVALTASASEARVDGDCGRIMDGVLSKPFKPRALVQLLDQLVPN